MTSLHDGGFQILSRFVTLDIFRGVQKREVAPHDFLVFVTRDTFRALVPTRHTAGWIECDDGVVLQALHEDAEIFQTFELLSNDFPDFVKEKAEYYSRECEGRTAQQTDFAGERDRASRSHEQEISGQQRQDGGQK